MTPDLITYARIQAENTALDDEERELWRRLAEGEVEMEE
jgi:hypothetical protein